MTLATWTDSTAQVKREIEMSDADAQLVIDGRYSAARVRRLALRHDPAATHAYLHPFGTAPGLTWGRRTVAWHAAAEVR